MSAAVPAPWLNPHIFRQYDIRGVVGRDVDEEVARGIGRAYATRLRRRRGEAERLRIALGRDNRPSAIGLAAAVREGVLAAGVDVVDVGVVPTPVHSWATSVFELDGGVQVTGSHNPPEYNGFKMTAGGRSLYGEAIQELFQMITASDYLSGEGEWEAREVIDDYIEDVAGRFKVRRPIRVVVDCGNGTGSVVAVDLLRALSRKVEVIPLFCESDGTFPNHHPDPVVDSNLDDLIREVRRTEADLGVAFDGDADRIGAVDDRGRIVRGDTLLLLFGLEVLERHGKGQKLVFDVKCSQALPEVFERAGGIPIMARTGHSLIKERMKDEGALIAGELSGHIMFGDDYYGFDDALYGACLLVSMLSRRQGTLSEWLDSFPQFVSTSELRYPASEETKWDIVARAVQHFSSTREVIAVDGARVLFGDGWGLIRASNTEPVLVGRFEARTPERLAEIRSEMEGWLAEAGVPV
jgi:phosphomannomutase / phosphoglucomutase